MSGRVVRDAEGRVLVEVAGLTNRGLHRDTCRQMLSQLFGAMGVAT